MSLRLLHDLVVVAGLGLVLALAGTAPAQTPAVEGGILVPRTEKFGPAEFVTEFVAAPDADRFRLSGDAIARLAESLGAGQEAARQAAELELGVQVLGDTTGALGALATLGEHALFLESFGPVNNALTNIGGVFALAQVSRDAWNGNDSEAATGALKGLMSFAISKWGWGPLQVGGVALFVVDFTLRKWQKAVVATAYEGLQCHYEAWYAAHPRPLSDWIARAWDLYLLAERENRQGYPAYLDIELGRYANLAFQDPQWITYGDCGDSTLGLGHDAVEIQLADNLKLLMGRMLADKVLPQIGERAWRRNLAAQVEWANTHLVPRLNKVITLEITTYGYPEGTRVVMPLPRGTEWAGKLRPEGTFKAAITKFALAKAGFPDLVRLEGPNGTEERRLTLVGDRLSAMFGTPVTPFVTRFRLSEGPGSCTITRTEAGDTTTETQAADSHGSQLIDSAMLPNGKWVQGKFTAEGGWSLASPGDAEGARTVWGAPLLDGITAMTGCTASFLVDDSLARAQCTVERRDEKQVSARVRIQRICTSPGQIELLGVFTDTIIGEMGYYPVDGPEGQMIVAILKESMKRGVAGGSPGTPQIPGLPDIPAMPDMPAVPGGN